MALRQTLTRLCWSLCIAAAMLIATAAAAMAAPALRVTTLLPDFVTPGRAVVMFVSVQNVGTDPLDGDLVLRYTFPDGVSPVDPETVAGSAPGPVCQTMGQEVECVVDATGVPSGSQLRWRSVTIVDPSATGTLF